MPVGRGRSGDRARMGAVFDQVWEIVAVCAIVAIVLVAGVVGAGSRAVVAPARS